MKDVSDRGRCRGRTAKQKIPKRGRAPASVPGDLTTSTRRINSHPLHVPTLFPPAAHCCSVFLSIHAIAHRVQCTVISARMIHHSTWRSKDTTKLEKLAYLDARGAFVERESLLLRPLGKLFCFLSPSRRVCRALIAAVASLAGVTRTKSSPSHVEFSEMRKETISRCCGRHDLDGRETSACGLLVVSTRPTIPVACRRGNKF